MDSYQKLKALVDSMDSDCVKFHDSKVKVCATRYRAKLLACKKLCGVIRKEVQATVKAIPVKRKATSKPIDIPKISSPKPLERSVSVAKLV